MPLPSPEEYGRRLKAQREAEQRNERRLKRFYENVAKIAGHAQKEDGWYQAQEDMSQTLQTAVLEIGRAVKEVHALLKDIKEQQAAKGRIINSTAYEFVEIGRDENGDIASAKVVPVLKH